MVIQWLVYGIKYTPVSITLIPWKVKDPELFTLEAWGDICIFVLSAQRNSVSNWNPYNRLRQVPRSHALSMPWLLMIWRRKEQPWYWSCSPVIFRLPHKNTRHHDRWLFSLSYKFTFETSAMYFHGSSLDASKMIQRADFINDCWFACGNLAGWI